MTKMNDADKKQRKATGINMKEMRACALRAKGYTQFDAYCLSHKVSAEDKSENRKGIEDKTYRLFQKPRVREYLRELLAKKTLEDILSRAEWLLGLLDDIQSAREAKNWAAVMNGKRMAGQAVAALRESVAVVTDGAERIREIIEAFAGDNPERRKAIELITGKVGPHGEIFEPKLVVDNNGAPRLPRGVQKDKGE